MNLFNRVVVTLLWLSLLGLFLFAIFQPFESLAWLQVTAEAWAERLRAIEQNNSTNFLIGQIAATVAVVLVLGLLLWMEVWPRRRRGLRVQTREGSLVELDTSSVERRLAWHLDQLAEVITVIPVVKARGSAVDMLLEIETAPDVDVPMKTDEVVDVTRDIIEQDMGLKLGKLDVRIYHAPFEEEWVA